jgi:hypothetical protein
MNADTRFDVFISYSHMDAQSVVAVASGLRRKGLRLFLDVWEYNNTQPFSGGLPAKLAEVISASKSALFFSSKSSSSWIELELELLKMRSSNDVTFQLGYVCLGGVLKPPPADIGPWRRFNLPKTDSLQIVDLCDEIVGGFGIHVISKDDAANPPYYSNFKNEGSLSFLKVSSLGDILYVQELVYECQESSWDRFSSNRTKRAVGVMEWDSTQKILIRDRRLTEVSGQIAASYDHSSGYDTRERRELGSVTFENEQLRFDVHETKELENEYTSTLEILEHVVEHFEYNARQRSLSSTSEKLPGETRIIRA